MKNPFHNQPVQSQGRRSSLERLVGAMLVGLGVVAMLVVTLAGYTDVPVLPGRHDVVYFVGGILAAAGGAWCLGLFDGGDDVGPRSSD